jgi:uncharacterized protein YndB with AHSA1/START domain
MPKIAKTISINAPAEKIFDYWTDPANLPEFWPSVVEVKDRQRLPNGGNTFRWVYKMVGMRFEGASDDVEYVANQRTVTESKGGIDSTVRMTLEPEGDGTQVAFEVESTVPVPLLGKLAEAAFVKLSQNEMDLLLANLKARMEA